MKKINIETLIDERYLEEDPNLVAEDEFHEEEWEKISNKCMVFDYSDSPSEVLDMIEEELQKHNLEIVLYGGHGGTFTMFQIQKREET